MRSIKANGTIQAKFNADNTQVIATIYPADGGDAVTYDEVIARLKQMNVTSGIKDAVIRDTLKAVEDSKRRAVDIVIAQGTLSEPGKDGSVRFLVPQETLRRPLPMHPRCPDVVDWFALPSDLMVTAGTDLATLQPPTTGTPGRTVTNPPLNVPATTGKPADIAAGSYVTLSEDGLRLTAAAEGFVMMNGNRMEVLPLHSVKEAIVGKQMKFPGGAILCADAQHSNLRVEDFLTARGKLINCRLRCLGDVFVTDAEECEIITNGNLYVSGTLRGCNLTVRGKIIELSPSYIIGGCIRVSHGMTITQLGDESRAYTEVKIGEDFLTAVRLNEIREELTQCEANIQRISHALRPFVSVSMHSTLSDDKRALLKKLQIQQQAQEDRIRALHNEKRTMTMDARENFSDAAVNVVGTVYPCVRIHIRSAMTRIETPYSRMQFVEGVGGKWVRMQALQNAA
jgi:uncharacterized protein